MEPLESDRYGDTAELIGETADDPNPVEVVEGDPDYVEPYVVSRETGCA